MITIYRDLSVNKQLFSDTYQSKENQRSKVFLMQISNQFTSNIEKKTRSQDVTFEKGENW